MHAISCTITHERENAVLSGILCSVNGRTNQSHTSRRVFGIGVESSSYELRVYHSQVQKEVASVRRSTDPSGCPHTQ